MIREIACDIENLVMALGYVNTHFRYCELIKDGNKIFPAQYVEGGVYEQVFNNDVGGNSYLRKNGDISFSSAPVLSKGKFPACGGNPFVKMSIPFRLVMVVPKTKLSDNAFSDDLLAMEMVNRLSADVSPTIYGVQKLDYVIGSYNTYALSVWSQEVSGVDYQMNFAYSYIAINFSAVLIVNPICITSVCQPY